MIIAAFSTSLGRSVSHSFARRGRSESLDARPFLAEVTLLVSLWVTVTPASLWEKDG